MSGHWWRAYDEALHDPKLIALPDRLFRYWFNVLCIASKNGGVLPAMATVAIELRLAVHKAAEVVTALVMAGLVDEIETGKFAPHNWNGRQFHSDVSTPRVKRFRERHRNVSSDVSETPPDTDTDTDTDTERKKDSTSGGRAATRPIRSEDFEEFWKAYPKREGANPKEPARKVFIGKLKSGTEAREIIAGAKACAAKDRDKIGTPYVPQAVKWLRDERWKDYLSIPGPDPPATDFSIPPWEREGISFEEFRRRNLAAQGLTEADVGKTKEIRSCSRSLQNGADHAGELPLPGGGSLRDENQRTRRAASDDWG